MTNNDEIIKKPVIKHLNIDFAFPDEIKEDNNDPEYAKWAQKKYEEFEKHRAAEKRMEERYKREVWDGDIDKLFSEINAKFRAREHSDIDTAKQ